MQLEGALDLILVLFGPLFFQAGRFNPFLSNGFEGIFRFKREARSLGFSLMSRMNALGYQLSGGLMQPACLLQAEI